MSVIRSDARFSWIKLVRYAVILAVPVLAIVAGQLTSSGSINPAFVIAGVVALAASLFLYRLRRFEYGLLTVVLSAGLINFFVLPTGRESPIVISLALSLCLLAIWGWQLLLTQQTQVRIRPSPINKPLLAYIFINLLAYVWSLLMRDPFLFIPRSFPVVQVAALVVNIGLPLMALLTANKFTEEKWLRALAYIIISLGTLNLVSRVFNLPSLALIHNASRGLFMTWVAALAAAIGLIDETRSQRERAAFLLVAVGTFGYYFLRQRLWLSGWLPMMIAIAVITFFTSRKLFVVAGIFSLVLMALNFGELYDTIVVANEEEGGLGRLEIWSIALRHIANHPLFGMGPAGYAVYYVTYNPTNARSTHNNYFDVVAQNGIVGLVAFVILLGMFVWIGLRTCRATAGQRNFREAFAVAALAGTIATIVGMSLGDWVLPFAYNQGIAGFDNAIFTWMMLGGMVGMYHLTQSPHDSATPPIVNE